ncbi:MAG: thiol-disulfide isomerase/thioredoxin [Marinoscillum sp.]|jgi:thiol-disulfide isomerase/thioredoxin
MKLFTFLLLFSISSASYGQSVIPISLAQLQKKINAPSQKLKVYNFWASWCGPCIQEMPYFNDLAKTTDVTLVSLDFADDIEKAQKIMTKKGMQIPSFLLAESDIDKYMLAIAKDWSGAIPATLFILPNGKRKFFEGSFEKQELDDLVKELKSN